MRSRTTWVSGSPIASRMLKPMSRAIVNVSEDNTGSNTSSIASAASLDDEIRQTYAERSTAINKNSLYDSYIRAIKWATLRAQ
jgi:predicted helicase